MQKPLICLAMMVKNEASSIRRTLESVKYYIDSWCILDTGSTDGTQDIIIDTLAGITGQLHQEPFIDFATTRNRLLDLVNSYTRASFALLLDGDEFVYYGNALRHFCSEYSGGYDDAYYCTVDHCDLQYRKTKLLRSPTDWRYIGKTHEVITSTTGLVPSNTVPGFKILREPGDQSKRREQWQRDLDILVDAVNKDPNDARSMFYLAQTYECLGNVELAKARYIDRINLSGWREEVYESKYRLAGLLTKTWHMRDWMYPLDAYLDAHTYSPHRAEPLYEIALHYHLRDDHALTYLFASRGFALPFPEQDALFVHADVYRWKLADLVGQHAYYLGEYEAGVRALEWALERAPEDHKTRLRSNLDWYTKRKQAPSPSIDPISSVAESDGA